MKTNRFNTFWVGFLVSTAITNVIWVGVLRTHPIETQPKNDKSLAVKCESVGPPVRVWNSLFGTATFYANEHTSEEAEVNVKGYVPVMKRSEPVYLCSDGVRSFVRYLNQGYSYQTSK